MDEALFKLRSKVLTKLLEDNDSESIINILNIEIHSLIESEAERRINNMTLDQLLDLL